MQECTNGTLYRTSHQQFRINEAQFAQFHRSNPFWNVCRFFTGVILEKHTTHLKLPICQSERPECHQIYKLQISRTKQIFFFRHLRLREKSVLVLWFIYKDAVPPSDSNLCKLWIIQFQADLVKHNETKKQKKLQSRSKLTCVENLLVSHQIHMKGIFQTATKLWPSPLMAICSGSAQWTVAVC